MTRLYTMCSALLLAWTMPLIAQERFETPDAAVKAFIDAVNHHDAARLSAILGPRAKGMLTSGDSSADTAEQTEFVRLAGAKHRLEIAAMNPNRAVLCIGDEDWPFPIPIVRTNAKWSFDASEAGSEMQARRIGTYELDAIEICHGYVEAQQKYASEDRDKDGLPKYASHLISSPGRHDGLYWKGANEPLIPEAFAEAEWYSGGRQTARPYHGYYFRILEKQGAHAPGGSHIYVVKDKLIGGFGLIAWPAEYGVTGIDSFMVNQNGVVYEKDIPPVAGKAPPVTSFDPDDSWRPVN